MEAVVVYESLWGNTAVIGKAIAEGIGPGARAASTAEALPAEMADVDLIVVGSPVLGFRLPSEEMLEGIRVHPGRASSAPDLTQPSMRTWLDSLPEGRGRFAAFETRLWWSPGGAVRGISDRLGEAGYRQIAKPARFIVTGTYGPLRGGEMERARLWGAELAKAMEDVSMPVGAGR